MLKFTSVRVTIAITAYNYRNRVQLQWIQFTRLLQELKKLETEVSLFNQLFAISVFAIKLAAIGFVVFCGFGATQYFHENPFLAISNAFFALDAVLIYNALYDRGFFIPRYEPLD